MSTASPRLLGGRYELGELIGRGGMAEVHKGYDTRLGRPVAVKILRSDHARDSSFLHRFRREAQSVAGLNHRSIVAVYDSGEDEVTESGGARLAVPYIVMELVEGRTLREVLNDEGALPPDEAARIVEGVLDALAYSHRMGIVHRDIKPGNVMLGSTGVVKVMDFGIARAMADAQATMTQTAAVIGTAQYVSPEQARGETVDNRSDVYSAGCLLFELLTARTPYTGEPISLTYQHVNADIPRPSELDPSVPEDMDAIVVHALTKDRDERYQDAEHMADDLRDFQAHRPISPAALASLSALGAGGAAALSADPTVALSRQPMDTSTWVPAGDPDTSTYPAAREQPRRGRGLGWLLALLLLIPLAAGAWYLWDSSQEPDVQQVSVPRLVGLPDATAQAKLEELGLRGQAEPEEDADVDPGEVLSQDPPEGRAVDPGTIVTYKVSTGAGKTFVPKLVGLSRSEAQKALSESGLTLGEVSTEDSPDQKKNRVLSVKPGEFEEVDKGTEVDITVASGQVELEDYRGKNVADVRADIYALGLTPVETARESDQPEGTILEQSPGAGKVAQGSKVNLTVAKSRAQTVTTTETPTPTSPSSTPTDTPPDDSTEPTSPTDPTEPSDSPTSPTEPDPRSTTRQTP